MKDRFYNVRVSEDQTAGNLIKVIVPKRQDSFNIKKDYFKTIESVFLLAGNTAKDFDERFFVLDMLKILDQQCKISESVQTVRDKLMESVRPIDERLAVSKGVKRLVSIGGEIDERIGLSAVSSKALILVANILLIAWRSIFLPIATNFLIPLDNRLHICDKVGFKHSTVVAEEVPVAHVAH